MTESKALVRAAVVLVSVAAVLLPATAAHASLPLDTIGGDSSSQSAQPASDDEAASDDSSDDGSAADTTSDGSSDEGDDAAPDDSSADSGGSPYIGRETGSSPPVAKARPGKPRGLRARLSGFDRAGITWRAGTGAAPTRWVVALRSGRSGRLVFVRASVHAASFAALKSSTRYVATVTAYGKHGSASASTSFRTPSPSAAVRQATKAKDRADRDLRLAKAARYS